MADYTSYWKAAQADREPDRVVRHAASEQLGSVRPGDTVWIVTVRKGGELRIVARIVVWKVCKQAEAERLLGPNLWEADHHIITAPGKAELPRAIPLTRYLRRIQFEGTASTLRPKRGRVDAQQVRRLRKITPETAALFNRLWGEPPAASLRRISTTPSDAPDLDDTLGIEGDRTWRRHLAQERDRRVVEAKKRAVLKKTGRLACEVCRFDFHAVFGDELEGFCEVHHRIPLSQATRRLRTRLEDLAILCANCHRAIHRMGPEMPAVEELRARRRG